MQYNYREIEEKWRQIYKDGRPFKNYIDYLKKNYRISYCPNIEIDVFVMMDIKARYLRMKGYNVSFPLINLDKDALLKRYGISVSSSGKQIELDEFLFKEYYTRGLLSHRDGKWFLKIDDVKGLLQRCPDSFKSNVEKLFSKQECASFDVHLGNKQISVTMNNPELIYGSTYLIVDKNHSLLEEIICDYEREEIENFIASDNRYDEAIFSGTFVDHPLTGNSIPVFIGCNVENGIAFAVPAHDQLAYVIAKKYDLDIYPVVDADISLNPYLEEGVLVNSSFLDQLTFCEAREKVLDYIEKMGIGTRMSHFEQSSICIGIDDALGQEIVLNQVIYHVRLSDSLKAMDFMGRFVINEGEIRFDEYAIKDIKKYLPIDEYYFSNIEDYVIVIHGIAEFNPMNSSYIKSFKKHKQSTMLNDEFVDMNRLYMVCQDEPLEVYSRLIDDIWNLSNKEFEEKSHFAINYYTLEVTNAFEKSDYRKVLALIKNLVETAKNTGISKNELLTLVKLIHPLMPFLSEEIYSLICGKQKTLCDEFWPLFE